MSQIRKLIKGGSWLTLGNTVSKIAAMLALPAIARLLGPESLGIYSVVFTLAQTAQGVSAVGADVAMQRNGAQHETTGTEAVGRLFAVGLTLVLFTSAITAGGVWLFRSELAQHWLGQPGITPWIGIAAVLILLQPIGNIPLLFLASLQDFRAYALRSSVGVIFSSAVTVLLAWHYGLKGAMAGMVLSAVAQILWSYLIIKPILEAKRIRLRLDKFRQEVRAILKLGFPYYFGSTLLPALAFLPLMGLVGKYGGLSQLGYLRVAQSLAALIGFVPAAIAPAAMSYLSSSWIGDKESYETLRSMHLRSIWIMLLVFTVPVCFLLPTLITALYGPAYDKTYVLSWLSLWISLLAGIGSVLVQYLVVAGKTVKVAWISTLGIGCFILSALVLVPRYQALGFLLAQLLGQIVATPFVIYPTLSEMKPKERALIKNLLFLTLVSLLWTLAVPLVGLSQLAGVALSLSSTAVLSILIFVLVLQPSEQLSLRRLINLRVSSAFSGS
jgi:O-antigen/teichoic acid export membrane protein